VFQPKPFFHASLKIIGVLTIIWSLTQVVPVISQFYSVYNQPELMRGNDLMYFRFSLIFQVIYPILLFAIGFSLLRGGKAMVEWAFRDSDDEGDNTIGVLFTLFMKLAGLVLIIIAIPKAFQIISNLLFVSSANTVDTSNQVMFIAINLVTTIINLLLGFYLLRSGKIFYRLGFAKQNDEDDETY
jgi:hypothetical protein